MTVEVKPYRITLKFAEFKDINEMKSIWDQLEAELPDLGKPAEPSDTHFAKNFRKKQKEPREAK